MDDTPRNIAEVIGIARDLGGAIDPNAAGYAHAALILESVCDEPGFASYDNQVKALRNLKALASECELGDAYLRVASLLAHATSLLDCKLIDGRLVPVRRVRPFRMTLAYCLN